MVAATPKRAAIGPHLEVIVMNRSTAPIVSGVVAAIAVFVVWLLLDNSVVSSLIFAVLAGLVAYGVTFYQNRTRS